MTNTYNLKTDRAEFQVVTFERNGEWVAGVQIVSKQIVGASCATERDAIDNAVGFMRHLADDVTVWDFK